MGNLLSYVKWRGDLSFEEQPFNHVDNVVLSMMAYLNLEGIVPGVGREEKIIASEAIQQLLERYEAAEEDKPVLGLEPDFVKALGESKRFGSVYLSNYKDVSNIEDTDTDFAAIQIHISKDVRYLAYRGTGNKLIGWREDFSMSFQVMPAQQMALEYMNQTFQEDISYYIGGHSKGGNLALYAAAYGDEEKQNHILKIYSNDGPGLCSEIIPAEKTEKIKDKLIRIVPEFCIIGALFQTDAETIIVKSELDNVAAHDALTWRVEGTGFLTCEQNSDESKIYNEIFSKWIESADMEHRMIFTRELFEAIEAGGAKSVTDLAQGGIDDFLVILLSITQSDDKAKRMVGKFVQTAFSTVKNINFERLMKDKVTAQALFLFVLGILITLHPLVAVEFAGTAMGLIGIIYMGKRLMDGAVSDQGTMEARKMKIVIQLVIICVLMYLIAEKNILLELSNLMIGVAFLLVAYYWLTKGFSYKRIFPHRISGLLISGVSFAMGIVPIIIGSYRVREYMTAAGSYLWLYGIGILIYNAYKNGKVGRSINTD